MHRTTHPARFLACLLVAATAACGGGAGTGAAPKFGSNAGVGAPYGARDPRTCPDRKQPTDGAVSPAQAAAYVTCTWEGESANQLYLVDHVEVTGVAKGRPYNPVEDRNMTDIDIEAPVYAIQGHFEKYQCDHLVTPGLRAVGFEDNKGHNCREYDQPEASGLCYKNTFADWHCSMLDISHDNVKQDKVGPPA